MGQTEILLEYQRLEELWDKIEKQEYSEKTQALLESIGERQCELLNCILIQ